MDFVHLDMYLKILIIFCLGTFAVKGVIMDKERDVDSPIQMSKRKNQYSFNSLRFENKYVFHKQSQLKDSKLKVVFEKQLQKDRDVKKKFEEAQELRRQLEDKIYKEQLLSRIHSAVLRDFHGRLY